MASASDPAGHWTTRRGFIAAAGFGGVGLYGLWVAYGAAPGPLALFAPGHPDGPAAPAAVHAEAPAAAHADVHADGHGGAHGGHGADLPAAGAADAEAFRAETEHFIARHALDDGTVYPQRTAAADPVIEVPMIAGRWYYRPAALRLDTGQDYRLRLMTMDVSHGASIQFGRGARMLRLRPGTVTELDLRFTRPGRHLVVCTVYCGAAHDVMRATIEVV